MDTKMPPPYNRSHPFLASIKERINLSGAEPAKSTYHLVLDLQGSHMTYQVGDSLAIFPDNHPIFVEQTLQAMGATGSETILDKHAEFSWTLRDFLTKKANLGEVSRKLLSEVAFRQTNLIKQEQLQRLFQEENKLALKELLGSHHLWDVLLANEEVRFAPQELCNLLMPLLPRFYSIASSQHQVGEEVHLTVALLEYLSNGYPRLGTCSHFLCCQAPLHVPSIPVYVQPHHGFTLPADPKANLIMIGPGTGVAPFRAFLQERVHQQAPGKNWLFFGERHRATGFFYQSFWEELERAGTLRLDLAFSRDQEYKIYVQHRMLEKGKELYKWLEEGATLFVCGDASRMAKDVEAALAEIVRLYGNKDEQAASGYLKQLKSEKRYLRDVY
jgi:sulfite reductase (NADPH) flavoprotein alpha-component